MQISHEQHGIDIARWGEVYGKGVIELPGGNFYKPGKGYLTDHIPPHLRRDLPDHWNQQFANADAFELAWKPRPGPLELIHNLAIRRDEPYSIVNFGGGLGDFSIDLARAANTRVTQVDFSERANAAARSKARLLGIDQYRFRATTVSNIDFLEGVHPMQGGIDFIFFYGGLGENTPDESTIQETLGKAVDALAYGGYIWYVGLEQPMLVDPSDMRATDIVGEYAVRPGLVSETMNSLPDVELVREEVGERPDFHPLNPGFEPQDHMHIVHRALYGKGLSERTPAFGFKDAVGNRWNDQWRLLTGQIAA